MSKELQEIQKLFPEIILGEPLKKHSTFGIGGSADYFCKITDAQKIPALISLGKKRKIPYLIIGGGSNVLFSDQGFRGLVIKNCAKNIKIEKEAVTVDSGVTISELLRTAINSGLMGMEKWVGLPGTVGGAIRGNAGCNTLEVKDILEKALVFNPKTGKTKEVKNSYFAFSYRTSKLKKTGEIVLNATFKLQKRTISTEAQKKIMDDILTSRRDRQPFGLSCGSFFKNPTPKKPAGMLIDKVGLRGKVLGKAKISEKHANFFLNTGGATAKEIIRLAKLAKRMVKAKFGITLQEEIQIFSQKGQIKL